MDKKTMFFIKNLNEKLQYCTYEFIKLEKCEEREQVKKELKSILLDIDIMINLIELFMLLDRSYASELGEIHEKLIQIQEAIQFEYTSVTVCI
ncbi:hypothetical protein ICY_04605 [Bacillus cereus BAG2X1-3]|nr:hypothetical protein ICU_04794 [Bacillus cereus BAG2X1-1]EJS69181.1 hypothetical protein ICY_04605 [Bacillus cereus BAG2X1-3]